MMSNPDIRHLMALPNDWISGVLPHRDPRKTVLKLNTESVELTEALLLGFTQSGVKKEIGDCLILLLDICKLTEIDPVDAFHHALGINQGRQWVEVNGSLTHVKEK